MSTIYSRLLMILVGGWLMVPMLGGDVAWAQQEAALNGAYNLSMNRSCATGIGFIDITLQGTVTYNGAGAANFQGVSLVPANPLSVPDGSQATQDCSAGTYTVDANGRLTHTLNTCNLTFTAGPTTGIATYNGIVIKGQLSLDGTVILLHDTDNNTEVFELNPPGTPTNRVCNGIGMATSRR